MNWFIHGYSKTLTEKDINEADEVCPHAKVGDVVYVTGEQDSFGPVSRIFMCKDCKKEIDEAHDKEIVTCADCGEQTPRSNTVAYKYYGFDVREGDEPRIVCLECAKLPRHQARLKNDQAMYDEDVPSIDHDDFEDLDIGHWPAVNEDD